MNPADLALNTSPSLASKALPTKLAIPQNNGKAPIPRVDLEPIYTQLKAALGDLWTDYKAAINAFVLGNLNQAELSWVLQPLLSPAPSVITSTKAAVSPVSTLHLHNSLIVGIYANTLRDPPPTDVAPWVVATDKPSTASKNAGAGGVNDKAEERLKKEVMAIHARDRRRIKNLDESINAVHNGFTSMQDYKNDLAVKPPDIAPQSAGGLTRTNFDIEIRRRYAQPLAQETLEVSSQNEIQSRIEPICYEEALPGGAAKDSLKACSELLEQATEVFLKELLAEMFAHARSNTGGCVYTSKFRRQLRKEEDAVEQGTVHRNPAGRLPVELEVQVKREPLGMDDMRLAAQLQDRYVRSDPFLMQDVLLQRYSEAKPEPLKVNGIVPKPITNGIRRPSGEDAMMIDDSDWNWRGGTRADADSLMSVLDECLAVG